MQDKDDGTPLLCADAGEAHRLIAGNEERFTAGSPEHLALGCFQAHLSRDCVERFRPAVLMDVGLKAW